MNEKKHLSSLTMQFALASMICTLAYLIGLSSPASSIYPLILFPYALILYACNSILLRRQRTLLSLVLWDVFLCAVSFSITWILSDLSDLMVFVFALLAFLVLTGNGFQLSLYPPALHTQLLYLDISALLLILFTAYILASNLSVYQAAPAVAGCAAMLLGTITRRLDRPLGKKGWGVLLVIFLIMFSLMWLLVSFVAAPAGRGILAAWNLFWKIAAWLGSLLLRLLELISVLFPTPDAGPEINSSNFIASSGGSFGKSPSTIFVLLMLAVLCVFALLTLIHLLRMMGKQKIGGQSGSISALPAGRRGSGILSAMKELFFCWKQQLRLSVFLFRHRNTPLALFYFFVRKLRLTPWHQQPGETPREFLARLQSRVQHHDGLSQAMEKLIPAVDAALYAPPKASLSELSYAPFLRRYLVREVRRLQGISSLFQ